MPLFELYLPSHLKVKDIYQKKIHPFFGSTLFYLRANFITKTFFPTFKYFEASQKNILFSYRYCMVFLFLICFICRDFSISLSAFSVD